MNIFASSKMAQLGNKHLKPEMSGMSQCQVRSLVISNPEPWGLPHSRLVFSGAPVISTRAPIVVGWLLVPTRLSAPEISVIVW